MDFRSAFSIQQDIDSKLEQIARLKELATKTTSVISGMPHGSRDGTSAMENAIVKLIEHKELLEQEISVLIIKRMEIADAIAALESRNERTVLELRYLCGKKWWEIAKAMNLSRDRVFCLHRLALKNAEAKTILNDSKQQ